MAVPDRSPARVLSLVTGRRQVVGSKAGAWPGPELHDPRGPRVLCAVRWEGDALRVNRGLPVGAGDEPARASFFVRSGEAFRCRGLQFFFSGEGTLAVVGGDLAADSPTGASLPREPAWSQTWSSLSPDGQIHAGSRVRAGFPLHVLPQLDGSLWVQTAGWVSGVQGAPRLPATGGRHFISCRIPTDGVFEFAGKVYHWDGHCLDSADLPAPALDPDVADEASDPAKDGLWLVDVSTTDDEPVTFSHLTFQAPAGRMTIICGPSGAGKTRLLDLLAGERRYEGGVLLNGRCVPLREWFEYGYAVLVASRPDVMPDLTVRQAVTYAYALRNVYNDDDEEAAHYVEQSLAELGLTSKGDSLVRGLSDGERKRVSLAVELTCRPDLILLDEPNSGLDAYRDEALMELLRHRVAAITGYSPNEPYRQTVVVVTHVLEHATSANDTAIALARGTESTPFVAYEGPGDQMLAQMGAQTGAQLMKKLDSRDAAGPKRCAPWSHQGPVPTIPETAHVVAQRPKRRLRSLVSREFARRHNPVRDPERGDDAEDVRARMRAVRRVKTFVLDLVWPLLIGAGIAVIGALVARGDLGPTRTSQSLAAMLVTLILLSFLAIAITAPSVMADLVYLRREQRWGISARDQVLARYIGAIPRLVLIGASAGFLLAHWRSPSSGLSGLPACDLSMVVCLVLVLTSGAFGLFLGTMFSSTRMTIGCLLAVLATLTILSGCAVPLLDLGAAFNWVSALVPTRWAGAAWCSYLGITHFPQSVNDGLWRSDWGSVARDLGMLAAWGLAYLGLAAACLRSIAGKSERRP